MVGLQNQTYSSIIHTINTVLEWKGKPRITAYLSYEQLLYSDPLKLSLDSNMTTSNLNNFTEEERRHLISLITNSADKDLNYIKIPSSIN